VGTPNTQRVEATFDGPAKGVRAALAASGFGIASRVGVHTGERQVRDGMAQGEALETAALVASHARPGDVAVTSTVKALLAGSGIALRPTGMGPGGRPLYLALDGATEEATAPSLGGRAIPSGRWR